MSVVARKTWPLCGPVLSTGRFTGAGFCGLGAGVCAEISAVAAVRHRSTRARGATLRLVGSFVIQIAFRCVFIDYARCLAAAPAALGAAASAAPAAPPMRQLLGDGRPFGVERGCPGLNGLDVVPIIRIETKHALGQPVPLLRRPRPAQHALAQFLEPLPQARGVANADGPAEQRLIFFNDGRRGLDRLRRPARFGAPGGARRTVLALASVLHVDAKSRAVALQRRPVERQVRMRMLERFHHLGVERMPPDFHV